MPRSGVSRRPDVNDAHPHAKTTRQCCLDALLRIRSAPARRAYPADQICSDTGTSLDIADNAAGTWVRSNVATHIRHCTGSVVARSCMPCVYTSILDISAAAVGWSFAAAAMPAMTAREYKPRRHTPCPLSMDGRQSGLVVGQPVVY